MAQRGAKRRKLYWADPGVVRAVKRQLGPPTAEEKGSLLESWVATTLQAHAEALELYEHLSYWAPHQSAVEVGFILQRGGELLAIEVKVTNRYQTGLLKGLRALDAVPGLVRRILVYTGERSFRSSDGVEIWPAHRFAIQTASGTLWP
ncbi:MAG: DUF4143 domain-containing protein [Gammaproteobacteria bacterium]|nr:DUF4143 domain-containing protein [Gammaproteobacteria bacterium]